MPARPFTSIVREALAATPSNNLLATSSAVILERIALGGGATKWFYCPDKTQLAAVEAQFRPGSVVSFYFDQRIQNAIYSPEVKLNIERIISETGDAVVGPLSENRPRIDIEIVTDAKDLADLVSPIDFCII